MKTAGLLFFFYVIVLHISAQKPFSIIGKSIVDTNAINNWPKLGAFKLLSNNGEYFAYAIHKIPTGKNSLIVKSTANKWERCFILPQEVSIFAFFSGDGKSFIFRNGDSLHTIVLGEKSIESTQYGVLWKWPESTEGEWMAFKRSKSDSLVFYNFKTGLEKAYAFIDDCLFDRSGTVALLKNGKGSIYWLDLSNLKLAKVWSDSVTWNKKLLLNDFHFDKSGNQVSFIVQGIDINTHPSSVWYYKPEMSQAIELVSNKNLRKDSVFSIGGTPTFSQNGKYIFFRLIPSIVKKEKRIEIPQLSIWGYRDKIIQPAQIFQELYEPKSYMAVVSTENGSVLRIEMENEWMVTAPHNVTGNYIVLTTHTDVTDYWWNFSENPSFYLISLDDGTRKLINVKKASYTMNIFSFSPNGKYLVYYDHHKDAYFSLHLISGRLVNISKSIPVILYRQYINQVEKTPVSAIAGWEGNDSSLIVYDNYDIWLIDPMGVKQPVNITVGYGFKKKIIFRLVYGPGQIGDETYQIYNYKDQLLLTSFDPKNKYNGLYQVSIYRRNEPELLTMGPFTLYRVYSQKPHYYSFSDGMLPLKALKTNAWVIRRETEQEAPNYYFTRDFKKYIKVTDLKPQQNYNWLSAELVTWRQTDGTITQGILYKPEDFDRKKKYPVIFNYYEQLSHRLYEFPNPTLMSDNINIPWFVSRGYLVFTPDIHYSNASISGRTVGECAYNSIVSGARHLMKLPFVDGHRMAIQGHSFGGLETNFIVAHTKLFAAAMEAAGSSDPISAYLTLNYFTSPNEIEYFNKQTGIEMGHELYGANPWQRPDLYQRNSAVLHANKVSTPLLIMHNMSDNQVQWRQGVEMYMALRRLGKKVWMLQYDNGGHGVRGKDALDYTLRVTQFFNYYLQNAFPPIWMTNGIPASRKGIELGYELDSTGKVP